MKMSHIYVLVYSKYSPKSKLALDWIEQYNLNNIQLLCIDNRIVRQKVSTKIKIC